MAKQLNISKVREDNKRYNEKHRIEWDDGEVYLDIWPYLKPEKIDEMFEYMSDMLDKIEKEELDFDVDKYFYDFIMYCIIITFSTFSRPSGAKSLLQHFIDLINSRFYNDIALEFPQVEVNKVFEKIFKAYEVNAELTKIQEQFKKQLESLPLENKDILFPKLSKEENTDEEDKEKQIPEV